MFHCRGEKAFCSNDCRSLEIVVEEEREKSSSCSPDTNSARDDTDDDDIFMTDMAFAAEEKELARSSE